MCLRCLWHLIICLRCYDAFFLLANMFSLLYVFLWECVRSSASNVFAFLFTFYGLMRSYCWCYFLLLARSGFTRSVLFLSFMCMA